MPEISSREASANHHRLQTAYKDKVNEMTKAFGLDDPTANGLAQTVQKVLTNATVTKNPTEVRKLKSSLLTLKPVAQLSVLLEALGITKFSISTYSPAGESCNYRSGTVRCLETVYGESFRCLHFRKTLILVLKELPKEPH